MGTPDPGDITKVHIQTELQYDYVDESVPSFPSGSLSALVVTDRDSAESGLTAYYIASGKVYSAFQPTHLVDVSAGDANLWLIEDTNWPASSGTPNVLKAISKPDMRGDLVVGLSLDGQSVAYLETSKRFPVWNAVTLPPSSTVSDLHLFRDLTGDVKLLIQVGDTAHFADATSSSLGSSSIVWNEDLGYKGNAVLYQSQAIAIDAKFAEDLNQTTFGYAMATTQAGLMLVTGLVPGSKEPGMTSIVDTGVYTSVTLASFESTAQASRPLIFALDASQNAYYFQAQPPEASAKYTKVPLLPNIKVQSLKAAVRSQTDPNNQGDPPLYAEVFALDVNGNLWHVESSVDVTGNSQLIQLSDGNMSVQAWRGTPDNLNSPVSGFTIPPASPGPVTLLTMLPDAASALSLGILTQDPGGSDWVANTVALPKVSVSTGTPTSVSKVRVYYVEATVIDGNGVPQGGRSALLSSTQYANINVNGSVYSVGQHRSISITTNGVGRVSFALVAPDGLGVPTFTIWVEGMDLNSVLDVSPNGAIQKQLVSLNVPAMRAAKNKDAPGSPPVFPATVTDDQLQAALTGIVSVVNTVDPTFLFATPELGEIDHSLPSRAYLHPRTKASGVRLVFGGKHLGVTLFDAGDGHKFVSSAADGIFDILDEAWDAVKRGVQRGLMVVKEVVLDPIVDGIKATIQLATDAANYVWNGVVNIVQKAYDVVTWILEEVGAAFDSIFGWFAMAFDWDAIKNTANYFQGVVNGFPAWINELLDLLPSMVHDGFSNVKTWLNENVDAATAAMQTQTVGKYDTERASFAFTDTDTGTSLLADLPSTATWLFNKIMNSASGSSSGGLASTASAAFDRLFTKAFEAVEAVGMNQDLENALASLKTLFSTFTSRGLFDAATWGAFLQAAKAFIIILLDIAEVATVCLIAVVQEAIKLLLDIINTPLDLPLVSSIFEEVTGQVLTFSSAVTFALAIPFNFLYVTLIGKQPFKSGRKQPLRPGLPPFDSVEGIDGSLMAKGIICLLHSIWTSVVDVAGSTAVGKVKVFMNTMNLVIPVALFGTGGYPAIKSGSDVQRASWALTAFPALLHTVFFCKYLGKQGPGQSAPGRWSLLVVGAGQIVMAINSTVVAIQAGTWSGKTTALVCAAWFTPWYNCCRVLNGPQFIKVKVIVDLITWLGSGGALVAAAALSTSRPSHLLNSVDVKPWISPYDLLLQEAEIRELVKNEGLEHKAADEDEKDIATLINGLIARADRVKEE